MNVEHQISSIEYRASRAGFSLAEVLIAVGMLAVGMLFIAGAFPVSIHFTTVATERSIAPIVADEAFAKCKIYFNYLDHSMVQYDTHAILVRGFPNEYAYPSTSSTDPYTKKYWWSAIFRRIDANDVEATIFVSRKAGVASTYLVGGGPPDFDLRRPDAIPVGVGVISSYELSITNATQKSYINDGYTIVDDTTGQIYRVLERYLPPNDSIIRLDKPWQAPPLGITPSVWVISPPVNSGRYPCIGVYQKVMRF